MKMVKILGLVGLVAGVLLILTGGHLTTGLCLAIGLTFLLGLLEPLTVK